MVSFFSGWNSPGTTSSARSVQPNGLSVLEIDQSTPSGQMIPMKITKWKICSMSSLLEFPPLTLSTLAPSLRHEIARLLKWRTVPILKPGRNQYRLPFLFLVAAPFLTITWRSQWLLKRYLDLWNFLQRHFKGRNWSRKYEILILVFLL